MGLYISDLAVLSLLFIVLPDRFTLILFLSFPIFVPQSNSCPILVLYIFTPHPAHTHAAYVVFTTVDDAAKSLAHNGSELGGKVLRVDMAGNAKKHDDSKSVFLGSLPFGTLFIVWF